MTTPAKSMNEITNRIVKIIRDYAADLRINTNDVPLMAAVRILAEKEIYEGIKAAPMLARIDQQHQPGGDRGLCRMCYVRMPCSVRRVLDSEKIADPSRPLPYKRE